MVIFGASGDLAKRKLIPSLYNLVACGQGMMPGKSAVLGFARREMSLDQFRNSAHDWTTRFSRLKVDEDCWAAFADGLDYLSGLTIPTGSQNLKRHLKLSKKPAVSRPIAFTTWRPLPKRLASRLSGLRRPA